jgi:hypothetical protein
MLGHLPRFREQYDYVLTCLQDSWPEIAMKGFEPETSGPTYYLTSCSPVVRALVYPPSGQGLIPGMFRSESAITRGKPDHAAAIYHVFMNYMLMC